MNVFLSYRRDDSQFITDRIYDWLVRTRGRRDIFKDVDAIPLGQDFRGVILHAVGRCDVLLAVIGPGWLTAAKAPGMRRLDDPGDFVRMEIEAALERGIPIVPLLVNNATMPTAEDLPPSLRPLAYRNGLLVRPDPDFHHDMERLIAALPKTRSPLRRCLLGGAIVAALALLLAILAMTSGRKPKPLESGTTVPEGTVTGSGITDATTTLPPPIPPAPPEKRKRRAGLTVLVNPSVMAIRPNGHGSVVWTLAETNNVGINIESRFAYWKKKDNTIAKTVGRLRTPLRIEPMGRLEWRDQVLLYEDAANWAQDGILILDESFEGSDDNGNDVSGNASLIVKVN